MEVIPKEKSAVWGPVQGHWEDNGVPYDSTDYESHFEDIGSGLDPADYFAQYLGGNSINYSYFGHEESDQHILEASQTTDQAEREELYGQALEVITPLAPINGICWPYVNQGISSSVKNYSVKRSSFRFRLHDVWLDN
jgi:ABC-type transport system substrate-binding protein